MLTVMDEYTRECLAIDVARRLTSEEVLERMSDLFICRACQLICGATTVLSLLRGRAASG